MTNITPPRPLTEAQEEWWDSFGRHLDAARKDFDRKQSIPSGLPEIDWWNRGIKTSEWLRR